MGRWHGIKPAAEKWGGAVSILEDELIAHKTAKIKEILEPNVNRNEAQHNVYMNISDNKNLVDLYSVGPEIVMRRMCNKGVEVPFIHALQIKGPQGEIVRFSALFDGAAMVAAMCQLIFKKVKHRLST